MMEESYPAELPTSEPQRNARQRLTCQQLADADGIFAYHNAARGRSRQLELKEFADREANHLGLKPIPMHCISQCAILNEPCSQ
jgi:hypothetical protein